MAPRRAVQQPQAQCEKSPENGKEISVVDQEAKSCGADSCQHDGHTEAACRSDTGAKNAGKLFHQFFHNWLLGYRIKS